MFCLKVVKITCLITCHDFLQEAVIFVSHINQISIHVHFHFFLLRWKHYWNHTQANTMHDQNYEECWNTFMWNSKFRGKCTNGYSSVRKHDFSNALNMLICSWRGEMPSPRAISNICAIITKNAYVARTQSFFGIILVYFLQHLEHLGR